MATASKRQPDEQTSPTAQKTYRQGSLWSRPQLSMTTVLVVIALLTAIGSLYVYMAGYREEILQDIAQKERQIEALKGEIAALQQQIADAESYMNVRPKAHSWGMRELQPGDLEFLPLPRRANPPASAAPNPAPPQPLARRAE